MGVAATQGSIFDWRELGAQVKENPQAYRIFLKKWSEYHTKAVLPRETLAASGNLSTDIQPDLRNAESFHTDLADCPNFVGTMLELNKRLAQCGENIEGNVCYLDQITPKELDRTLPTTEINHIRKRINLAVVARKSTMMLEIGLNGGHSALLCLMANPRLTFYSVDIFRHKYVEKAAEFLKDLFPHRFHYLRGDSRDVLPRIALERPKLRFDAIHVDGGHSEAVAFADVSNCLRPKFDSKRPVGPVSEH